MLRKKGLNEQIKTKKIGSILKKGNHKIKELSKNYTQKLKVNLSSSLKFMTKKNNSKKEKYNPYTAYLLNKKIIKKDLKKYDSEPKTKNIMIINNLINCKTNHFLAVFKDYLIVDYIDEFLRRKYHLNESMARIPKLYDYYKNYLMFFCKPTFVDQFSNILIKNYGESHAENFYKINIENKIKNKEKKEKDHNNIEIYSEENKNDDNGHLIKPIFTTSIKNSIDNINIEDYLINKKNQKNNLENIIRQQSSIKIEQNNKISEGNTLLLMLNEIKTNKKKEQKNEKNEKTINLKKCISSRNKYISNQSYKTLNINNIMTFLKIIRSIC